MSRETKTVQCYPSDEKINETCEVYGSFGWELIGNQRCREEHTYGEYINTSTFNKLTFSREKSSPWYDKVVSLENEYNKLMDSQPKNYAVEPSKQWLFWGGMGVLFAVLATLFLFGIGWPGELIFIPPVLGVAGLLLLTVFLIKRAHYTRDNNDFYSRKREWQNTTGKEAEQIRTRSEKLING